MRNVGRNGWAKSGERGNPCSVHVHGFLKYKNNVIKTTTLHFRPKCSTISHAEGWFSKLCSPYRRWVLYSHFKRLFLDVKIQGHSIAKVETIRTTQSRRGGKLALILQKVSLWRGKGGSQLILYVSSFLSFYIIVCMFGKFVVI